jgi:DNA-binding NarL/FixJ family response regulator
VRLADELRPDLILLDVGLPGLNGIAAAHEIRKLAPKTKIIFVTQESSADVVQVALATGAAGYIVKTDGNQLLAAVDEALAGIVRTEGHDAKVEPSRATKLLAVSVSLWLAR